MQPTAQPQVVQTATGQLVAVQPQAQPQLVQTATGQIVAVQPPAQPVVSAQPVVVSPKVVVQPNVQPATVQTVSQPVPVVQPTQAVVVQQWVTKPTEHVNCPPGLGNKLKFVANKKFFRVSIAH